MSQLVTSRATAERVGIWSTAILLIIAALWAVIRFVPSAPATAVPSSVTSVTAQDHTQGQGTVTLIEYADFQCPACKAFHPMVKQLITAYSDRVVFAYRYFPLTEIHQNAEVSAAAAEAAGRQGKFWEMYDRLFDGQESWAEERNPAVVFEAYAKDIGLNIDQYKKDVTDPSIKARIDSDRAGGDTAGVNATPTFYLNGQYLESPKSYDDFKAAIDNALKS